MSRKDIFIGTLRKQGQLETEGRVFLLSRVVFGSSQDPETAPVEVSPESHKRLAIVEGIASGDVLYEAKILEVLPRLGSAMLDNLLKKGILSSEELKSYIVGTKKEAKDENLKLCALVIGHKKTSPGAINKTTGLTEFGFNENLAIRIEQECEQVRIQRVYRRTYAELPTDINALEPDFVVSLHCNAFNGKASGTEVLYYHRSQKGKVMAEVMQRHLVAHLKLPDRGIKPKTSEDRGGYLLRYTKAPCIIVEPFFIDNDTDLQRVMDDLDGLVKAYIEAIQEISTKV